MLTRIRRFFAPALAALIAASILCAPAFALQAKQDAPALVASAAQPAQTGAIKDLYKQYELWEKQGIRFVVRDANGQFVTWGIGKLESWNGTRTVVCVRNAKGAFVTWAKGRIESWKSGTAMRYVFRDRQGHFLQWAPLDMTSAATFGENLDRLFRLSPKDSKHFSLLLEIVHESIVADLESGRTDKAFRFASAAFAHANDPEQAAKIAAVLKPVLAWLKPAVLSAPGDSELSDLQVTCADLANMVM